MGYPTGCAFVPRGTFPEALKGLALSFGYLLCLWWAGIQWAATTFPGVRVSTYKEKLVSGPGFGSINTKQGENRRAKHKTEMKRTFETLACLALLAIFSAVALGFCGYFD